MQKLEVLIEDNAFGSVRPVEVVADAPVGALVPALVEELKLPETDLFGKRLVYMLRHASGGRILPENSTLLASGVEPGTRLALDSYVLDGSVASPAQSEPVPVSPDPVLHSSVTIADVDVFGPLNVKNMSASLPQVEKKKRKWPRRAFLMFGGAILGVGGAGLGYAASHGYTIGAFNLNGLNANKVNVASPATAPRPSPAPTKAPFPTKAQTIFTFNNHQQVVRAIDWSPDGTMLASGADDAHVFIWSPTGTVQHDLHQPAAVMALAWAADGQRLVTGALNQVAFYNVQNAARLALHHHAKPVTSLAWTPYNQMQVVSASQDTHAIVWNTTSYRQQTVFMRHTTPVLGVSWSADGQTVASATQGGVIRVWQANNAHELHGGYDIKVPVRALAFAPTGTQLAVGGDDGMVRIWNGLTCQQQGNATIANQCLDTPLMLHVSNTPIRTLTWSPDARFLAVGTGDGKVTVWYPTQNQQKPVVIAQQNEMVHDLAWSPKGDQLASTSGNSVIIWGLM